MKQSYIKLIALLLVVSFILSGCMFPSNELAKNQVPNDMQLETVQTSIETYQEQMDGLLPIKTKDADTPIFEKYVVDFDLLKEMQVLAEVPGNAFENGGSYQYVIIHAEEDPQVKLIDLKSVDELRQLYIQIDTYRSKNLYPPFGEKIADDLFTIDYEKLKMDNHPTVTSPYTNENLPVIIDSEGNIYIDYRIDLARELEDLDHSYEQGDDIRYLLADNHPFVPVYSLPYTINENEEPDFLLKE
ncbi:MAG TPA: hypothetical protein VK125_05785 [Bacillota bacterium]|nr:hypothetical protein [Bacillota bacterium]